MKLTKSILREMIKDVLSEADIMDKEIKNPKTGNMIKVKTAIQLPDEHPANKKAKEMLAKSGDVGGPSYPNVPKKKKGKSVFDKDDEKVVSVGGSKVKGPKPDGDWDNEQVMNATIGGEKVSDIFKDEEHPDYDDALSYIMSFDPDDEKVVSGGGSKKESITSKIKKEFKQYNNINKNLTRG